MSATTAIEWTDATWNPVRGCSRISAGCGGPNHRGGCYAETFAARFSGPGQPFEGLAERTPHGGRWTGRLAAAPDETLTQPLRWKRPRRIFVNSMSDLFHEDLPDETIDRVFAVMALSPQHTFQVLTKRAARMRGYFERSDLYDAVLRLATEFRQRRPALTAIGIANPATSPLPNLWLGVSTEDQATADERIPHLLATPAAKRFISAEPLLGPIDLRRISAIAQGHRVRFLPPIIERDGQGPHLGPHVDWVIAGGESGRTARPMHPDWARSLRDQCAAAEVPFFFKQWGEWGPLNSKPPKEGHAIADDGTLYRMTDLAWPDGPRRGEALRANHDQAHLCTTYRVGKKAAGAELDGKLHREFPT
jgi:protein gp37